MSPVSLLSKLLLLPLTLSFVNAACPARLTAIPSQLDIVDDPVCPGDQGKAVVGDDGTHFLLQCCTKPDSSAQRLGQDKSTNSRKDCVDKCLGTTYPTCDSIEYDATKKTCTFFTLGGFSTVDAGGDSTDWLSFVNPPGIPMPANITHMCSTDCPAAHGQKYVSEYGELFHMECGKRHGTVPFKEEKTLTYRNCLDGCAKLPNCQSVDWSTRTKMCYYGKHSGAAPLVAPAYNSAYSFGCAGACDKDEEDVCGCGKGKAGKSGCSAK
ncbi:uncharacterized protein LDX57_011967 [Aspergillus melleus]|uniref:uncharacterized protein n=1 Tax=Aspergillus melleus TaxID=138277 RepID=UPI001E8E5B27|nr:uncharacterized protein LDX57_011967 [Aspergillus melleus]KAH8434320.1 hypothetical protein LDX57_011967 [Aspergillus melleus]